MPDYRFCAALRGSDGTVGEPVHEATITARDAAEAVARAKAVELDMTALRANALYVVDPGGYVVWSLRLADAGSEPQG